MNLIHCRECGKKIAESAPTCPICGAQNRSIQSSSDPIAGLNEQLKDYYKKLNEPLKIYFKNHPVIRYVAAGVFAILFTWFVVNLLSYFGLW